MSKEYSKEVKEFQKRWMTLLDSLTNIDQVLKSYEDLIQRYSEGHRAYHNLDHIVDCLRYLDCIKNELEEPISAELSLWFHDVICDPRSKNNEIKSAELAVRELSALGINEDVLDRIFDMIMVTKHPSNPNSKDQSYVSDIDLAILGSPEAMYAKYKADIREEYRWIPLSIYRRNRGKLLKGFLSQKNIYKTEYFYKRFEETARINLRAEIESFML
jgi:predicted metal-dependent HD superfamily phosphohydrolase